MLLRSFRRCGSGARTGPIGSTFSTMPPEIRRISTTALASAVSTAPFRATSRYGPDRSRMPGSASQFSGPFARAVARSLRTQAAPRGGACRGLGTPRRRGATDRDSRTRPFSGGAPYRGEAGCRFAMELAGESPLPARPLTDPPFTPRPSPRQPLRGSAALALPRGRPRRASPARPFSGRSWGTCPSSGTGCTGSGDCPPGPAGTVHPWGQSAADCPSSGRPAEGLCGPAGVSWPRPIRTSRASA